MFIYIIQPLHVYIHTKRETEKKEKDFFLFYNPDLN